MLSPTGRTDQSETLKGFVLKCYIDFILNLKTKFHKWWLPAIQIIKCPSSLVIYSASLMFSWRKLINKQTKQSSASMSYWTTTPPVCLLLLLLLFFVFQRQPNIQQLTSNTPCVSTEPSGNTLPKHKRTEHRGKKASKQSVEEFSSLAMSGGRVSGRARSLLTFREGRTHIQTQSERGRRYLLHYKQRKAK